MSYPIIPEQTLNGLCEKYKDSKSPIAKDLRAFQHFIESAVGYYNHLAEGSKTDFLKYHYNHTALVYRRVLTGMPEEIEG